MNIDGEGLEQGLLLTCVESAEQVEKNSTSGVCRPRHVANAGRDTACYERAATGADYGLTVLKNEGTTYIPIFPPGLMNVGIIPDKSNLGPRTLDQQMIV